VADERLQKVLARAGVASRRAAESLITARRVRVDGRIVSELGVRVPARARIEVDGKVVVAEPLVYLVLHKPRGVVCTLKDPEGRPTVAEYLKDVGARVVPVGRLDFHTSGALICTNDGELASKLMHPRHHAQKEYVAKVSGVVDERTLERLRERIVIDGRATQPAEVRLLRVEEGKSWLSVKLGEGRNRQVRRLGEHAGVPVMRLARVGHAGITAEGLRPGEWRRLNLDELRALKKEYGVPRRIHAVDPLLDSPRGGHVALRKPRVEGRRPREKERPRAETQRRDERRPRESFERAQPAEYERSRGSFERARTGGYERPREPGRPHRQERAREQAWSGDREGVRGLERSERQERGRERGWSNAQARARGPEAPRRQGAREQSRSSAQGRPRTDGRERAREPRGEDRNSRPRRPR
jgi:23S rRNA pseudouridine2605 synthase